MKRTVLVTLFAFIFCNCSKAQLTTWIDWQKSVGGTGTDIAWSVCQATDGGYVAVGETNASNGDVTSSLRGGSDFWVTKLSSSGSLLWQKVLGSSLIDVARCIQATSDGGYIIAGYSSANNNEVSGNHGNTDFWVAKLDGFGLLLWQKSLGGLGYEYANAIRQTTDGGYIVVGQATSNSGDVAGNHGGIDLWVVKIGSDGSFQWQFPYGGTGDDIGSSVEQTSDGGFIIAGHTNSNDGNVSGNHGFSDFWVLKLDNNGAMQWTKVLGGSGYDYARSVKQTFDGGYIVAGQTSSNNGDVSGIHSVDTDDCWIVKLDDAGGITWQKTLGGTNFDEAYSIQQTPDSGYIFSGRSNSNDGDVTENHGNYDYWIVKLDGDGNKQMSKSFGGTSNDYGNCITQAAAGGFIVAGTSNSSDGDVSGNHSNTYDFWIVKLNELVGISEKNNSLSEFSVNPNPVSQSANISFTLSQSENVWVKIHDVTGREVRSLLHTDLSKGFHRMVWNASDHAGNFVDNGIYLLTVITKNGAATKRVVVMK